MGQGSIINWDGIQRRGSRNRRKERRKKKRNKRGRKIRKRNREMVGVSVDRVTLFPARDPLLPSHIQVLTLTGGNSISKGGIVVRR